MGSVDRDRSPRTPTAVICGKLSGVVSVNRRFGCVRVGCQRCQESRTAVRAQGRGQAVWRRVEGCGATAWRREHEPPVWLRESRMSTLPGRQDGGSCTGLGLGLGLGRGRGGGVAELGRRLEQPVDRPLTAVYCSTQLVRAGRRRSVITDNGRVAGSSPAPYGGSSGGRAVGESHPVFTPCPPGLTTSCSFCWVGRGGSVTSGTGRLRVRVPSPLV